MNKKQALTFLWNCERAEFAAMFFKRKSKALRYAAALNLVFNKQCIVREVSNVYWIFER